MGVITAYGVEVPELGLSVSNRFGRAFYVVDAEITVEMVCGWPGSGFEVKIFDLPEKEVKRLADAVTGERHPGIHLSLGYLDTFTNFGAVLDGRIEKVEAKVESNKLVTTLKGLETGTAAAQSARVTEAQEAGTSAPDAIRALLRAAQPAHGELAREPMLAPDLCDPARPDGCDLGSAVRRGSLLEVLDGIARQLEAEMMVVDGQLFMGKPVRRLDYVPKPWHRDSNLVLFHPFTGSPPSEAGDYHLKRTDPREAKGFRFTVLGDPKLRPGHRVLPQLDGYDALSGKEFRVVGLKHKLSFAGGYVCEGVALAGPARGTVDRTCAAAVARLISGRVDAQQKKRPFVEVGAVKEHHPGSASAPEKHRATLYYGQEFPPTETQPSLRQPVQRQDRQVFRHKGLASPFAWHKCGLVVPVYPGMKALLHHNLALSDDAVVGGFLWSETPEITPPAGEVGDWWLCLPSGYDGSAPPSDSTKATNDLTASDGRRVIETKSFRLVVGQDRLRNVGQRPELGADDEILIEHKSGTEIRVAADGKVTIKSSEVTIDGDLKVTGNVEIT